MKNRSERANLISPIVHIKQKAHGGRNAVGFEYCSKPANMRNVYRGSMSRSCCNGFSTSTSRSCPKCFFGASSRFPPQCLSYIRNTLAHLMFIMLAIRAYHDNVYRSRLRAPHHRASYPSATRSVHKCLSRVTTRFSCYGFSPIFTRSHFNGFSTFHHAILLWVSPAVLLAHSTNVYMDIHLTTSRCFISCLFSEQTR
jgi:hypothetical protein